MLVPLQTPSELHFQFYNLLSKLDNTTASLKHSALCMYLSVNHLVPIPKDGICSAEELKIWFKNI